VSGKLIVGVKVLEGLRNNVGKLREDPSVVNVANSQRRYKTKLM